VGVTHVTERPFSCREYTPGWVDGQRREGRGAASLHASLPRTMPWHSTGRAPAAALSPSPIATTVDGRPLLFVPFEDAWYALEDRCSHAGCEFSTDGTVEGPHVICECHGSEFDIRTGRVIRPPAVDPIAVYRTRVHGGMLEVEW